MTEDPPAAARAQHYPDLGSSHQLERHPFSFGLVEIKYRRKKLAEYASFASLSALRYKNVKYTLVYVAVTG